VPTGAALINKSGGAAKINKTKKQQHKESRKGKEVEG
jgi:hypothetical protein